MKRYDFNTGWTCRPLSREGEAIPVLLPHDAMRTERRLSTSVGEGNIGWFEGGDYEYKKVFSVPAELDGQELILEFESVYHNAEVFLNGTKIAARPYGYTNFYVNLKPHLKPGENELTVIARNADQPNSRWYPGTGIYRPVWLWAGRREHILLNGIRIRTLDIDPARIQVQVSTSCPGTVRLEIHDGASCVASSSFAVETDGPTATVLTVPDAKLWSPKTPNLYTARVLFGDDVVDETFGIRTLTWTPEKGIALNGKRTVIRGACIHHDNGILGACTYPEVEERRIRILQKAGYNAVRSAHNPASKYLLDACDKLGMLMMDEYVDCWYMHKTEHDYASYVNDWWQQDLKDMVEKDYNHPCVFMYSTGNEVAESAQPKGIALQQSFTNYLHSLDDTRPVTCGINIFFNFLSSIGLGVYSDDKAKKQAEAAAKAAENAAAKKPKKKPVGSEFFNTLAAKLGTDFMKFGASLPPCDWKTKDAFAAMDIAGYNYGNWRYKKDSKKYPNRLILGSETLVGDAYDFWEIAKTTPQIVGDFVWAGWDYIGECGDSSPDFADYTSGNPEDRVRGGTNRIDMTGKEYAEADYTRVAFELEKGPKLAVFPVYEKEKPTMTGWQLTRAMRSWSWPGCDGQETEVEVYARASAVELLVNGTSVGKKSPKAGRCIFRTAYHDGEITAVSYDASGLEIGRDTLHTAGKETVFHLEPETTQCAPGEMVYFRIRITDGNGETKPMEKLTVTVSAENGELMGTANASCSYTGNFAGNVVPTYFGEAQAIVRAGKPGPIRVTAVSGSYTATAEVICK